MDTGGTFTDCVILNFERRSITAFKVPSTPHDPSIAIFSALDWALVHAGVAASETGVVLHATTVATNVLIEREGRESRADHDKRFPRIWRCGETRYDEFDLFPTFPEPLVPRYLRSGVAERIDAQGAHRFHQLDEEQLRLQLRRFCDEKVETVAISFLHSYANQAHELAAARSRRRRIPVLWRQRVLRSLA